MKYFIAYKQSEDTYLYVNSISSTVGVTIAYANAINFITESNAKNVCDFLNDYDKTHNYIIIKYTFSIKEV